MAEISTSFKLHDGMSEVLKHINSSLSTVIVSTKDMANVLGKGINKKGFEQAKNQINHINQKLNQWRQGLCVLGDIQNQNLKKQKLFNQSLRESKKYSNHLASSLKRAFTSFSKLSSLKLSGAKLIELSDGLTSLEKRLNFINKGSQSNKLLRSQIFNAAQRSRGDYLTMANMVADLKLMAGGTFANNNEAIAFIELMQKQFAIGGVSTEEQKASMLQIIQTMVRGKLSGDELNSLSKDAPLAIQSIAEYMGVSRGEVKELGAEGKITADIIKNALFASAEETNKKFKELPFTFAQFKQGLKNEASEAFTPLAEQFSVLLNSEDGKTFYSMLVSGIHMISRALGGLVNFGVRSAVFIKNHWDDVGYIFKGLGLLAGVVVAGKFLQMGASGVRAIAMIATNPYLLGIIAIGGGIIWLLRKMGVSWEDMAVYAVGAIYVVGAALKNIPIGIHNVLELGKAFFVNFYEFIKDKFRKTILFHINRLNYFAKMFNSTKLAKKLHIEIPTLDGSKWTSKPNYYKPKLQEHIGIKGMIEAFSRGKVAGKGFFNEASNKFKDVKEGFNGNIGAFNTSDFAGMGKNLDGIKSNTDKLAEAAQISADELVYLRSIAEARTLQHINQEFKIDVSPTVNGANGDVDYDGLFTDIVKDMKDELLNTKRATIGVI